MGESFCAREPNPGACGRLCRKKSGERLRGKKKRKEREEKKGEAGEKRDSGSVVLHGLFSLISLTSSPSPASFSLSWPRHFALQLCFSRALSVGTSWDVISDANDTALDVKRFKHVEMDNRNARRSREKGNEISLFCFVFSLAWEICIKLNYTPMCNNNFFIFFRCHFVIFFCYIERKTFFESKVSFLVSSSLIKFLQ